MISWIPGLRAIYTEPSRANEPFRQVAGFLGREATAGDVVIVHSIPSGVIGLARYMTTRTPGSHPGCTNWAFGGCRMIGPSQPASVVFWSCRCTPCCSRSCSRTG